MPIDLNILDSSIPPVPSSTIEKKRMKNERKRRNKRQATLSEENKRINNKKRNGKRRGTNRKRPVNKLDTRDIASDDPYWLPALEKAVVAVSAHYVDRRAKMEDGAEVVVRSFNDGTIMAIRDDIPVIISNSSVTP